MSIKTSTKVVVEPDAESRAWLDADLSKALPPYEWGKEGIPEGKLIQYDPKKGFVVTGSACPQG